MKSTHRGPRWQFLWVALCLLALCLPGLAEEPAKQTPLEKELEMVRQLIFNAQMKLRRGVIGVAPAGQPKDAVMTAGRNCCGDNILRIDASLEKVRAMVRDRGTCFEQKWDRGGTESVRLINQDLRGLSAGIQAFADAVEIEDTYGALDGTMRSYLNLRRRIDALPECSAGVPPKSE